MNTLYSVIGEPYVVDNYQATLTVDSSIEVITYSGIAGTVAQSMRKVFEKSE